MLLPSLSAYGQDKWPYKEHLQKEIKFWRDIFVKYDDDHYVLHEPGDLGIIYKVISFDPLTCDKKRERQIALEKYEITKTLLQLARKVETNEELTAAEKQMAQFFGDSLDSHKLKVCAYRVRAQQGIRNRFYQGLQRSLVYLPSIKKVFKDNGLPEDLAYLPHVESSFNPLAYSKSGAAGMWQFIRKTACIFMKVNSVIDERYDPIASTQAASALLKMNYEETGDWGLAITAYNYGLTGMVTAGQKYGGNYMEVRKKHISPSFQFASKNFYPEFLAAVDVMENYEKYFPGVKPASIPKITRYKLKNTVNLPQLAKNCDIDLPKLKEVNPAYTGKAWQGRVSVPAGYYINLPAKADLAVVAQYIEAYRPDMVEKSKEVVEKKTIKVARSESSKKESAARAKGKKTGAQTDNQTAKPVAVAAAQPLKPGNVKVSGDVSDNQTVKPQTVAGKETAGTRKVDKDSGPVQVTGLSLDSVKQELASVLAVKNKSIRVFGNETMGHYAKWLNVPSKMLCKINKLNSTQTLRQKQKLRLDLSHVSTEDFQKSRITYHIASIETMIQQHNLDQLIDYRLGEGESLGKVTQDQFKVPASLVLYFNSRQDLNNLHPGSVIRIPVSKSKLIEKQNS